MFLKPTADFATNRVPASAWIARWTHLVAPNAHVLDVACGAGRHLAWFAERGHLVTGIDREFAATPDLLDRFTLVCSDLESEPWPLLSDGVPDQFGAVVVTNYLWRPLMPTLVRSLLPGGIFLYETFASGNETVGRPTRPEYLLRPGELLQVCQELHVIAYEHGYLENPSRFVQRIAAIRTTEKDPSQLHTARHLL